MVCMKAFDMEFEKGFEFFALKMGLKIGYYRRIAGMTQQNLAEATDLSVMYIGRLEAPNMMYHPSLKVLYRISKALSVNVYKFLEVEND